MSSVLYAHSKPGRPEAEWEPLAVHARWTGRFAAHFGRAFGCAGLARAQGLLHDTGKASQEFQDYLCALRARGGDHSTWGAQRADELYGRVVGRMLAACIAGHHGGLPDGEALRRRLAQAQNDASRWRELIIPPAPEVIASKRCFAPPACERFERCPDALARRRAFTKAFLIRMLFSCLVDADFRATERFMADGRPRARVRTRLRDLDRQLTAHLRCKQADAKPTAINALRAEILAHAVGKATCTPGLFTLTVPTGGGKTLTSLAFALAHAERYGKRRVIHVAPFTAIVEQTADAIRTAVGNPGAILEHHANLDEEALARRLAEDGGDERDGLGPLRRAAATWDAPIVVTTAVQFFESLFANRPSRCRKLHNLANSVIILDEAQAVDSSGRRNGLAEGGCDGRSAAFGSGTSREAAVTGSSRGRSARDAAGVLGVPRAGSLQRGRSDEARDLATGRLAVVPDSRRNGTFPPVTIIQVAFCALPVVG